MKKISWIFLFAISFYSCSKDDDSGQNQNFQIDFTTVTIGSVAVEVSGLSPNNQIISSGLVWGTNDLPDIETNDYVLKPVVSGTFQDTIYGLLKSTSYNFRAFQQSENGIDYGPVLPVETLSTCDGQTFQGDVVLKSQKEVDDFNISNICAINGSLELTSENLLDPIVDISKFSQLTSVRTLQVYNNRELKSISGVQNIETVFEFIFIGGNRELLTIDELSSVTGSIESIVIRNNDKLIHLIGLNNIVSIGGAEGGMFVDGNNNLESLGSFDALEQLKNFNLESNPSLVSLDFPNLGGLIENFNISENGSLTSISSLGQTNEIEYLNITNCKLLKNLDGFNSLNTIGYIQLENSKVKNLNFLSNVIEGEAAYFNNNDDLSDFCGLQEAIQRGSYQEFFAGSNAFNPVRKDILNGNCSL